MRARQVEQAHSRVLIVGIDEAKRWEEQRQSMKKICTFILSILLVFTAVIRASPALAQKPKSATKNLHLYMYRSMFTLIVKGAASNYMAIIQLHDKALRDKDQAMLAHTKPAMDEIERRFQDVCIPLGEKIETGFEEQAKLLPDFAGKPEKSFVDLVVSFETKCHVNTMPSIERQPDGTVLSTVTLNRLSLHTMRLQVLIALNRKTRAAWAELDRSIDTSGYVYVLNARRHAKEMQKIYDQCEAADPAYEKIINSSKDLIDLRRRKAAFEKKCGKAAR